MVKGKKKSTLYIFGVEVKRVKRVKRVWSGVKKSLPCIFLG